MNFVTVISFAAGVIVGGILCAFIAQHYWRRFRRETTKETKQSSERQAELYSATAMVYRSALEKIEARDIEGAKMELSDSLAIFYRTKTALRRDMASVGIQPDEPDWTGRELRAIEHDAQRFECLRDALARKPVVSLEEMINERP
jgi:hypothetical protein